jgi:branched-chain amino acid transport system substrate-binding protein
MTTRAALTRRGIGAAALGLGTAALAPRARAAEAEPLRIGALSALTGPASGPGVGYMRGITDAIARINSAGGVRGRQIELIVRDTQGDPTKAVNGGLDLVSRQKVHAIWGPTNSGECLAATPVLARSRTPQIHPCFVDALIDPQKYPNAFRIGPTNSENDTIVTGYGIDVLKARDVAIVGDNNGYGVSAVAGSVAAFQARGANVVYSGQIDLTQPDMTPDMLRMRNAGAQVVVAWMVAAGPIARLLNARAAIGWNVPVIGHPVLGSGEVGHLVDQPRNWAEVYMAGFRNCSFGPDGALPAHVQAWLDGAHGKLEIDDTLLWFVLAGADAVNLIAAAVTHAGGSAPDDIIGYWNTQQHYEGLIANLSFAPDQHNGLPLDQLVMSEAMSLRHGAYRFAPGYG